MYLFRAGILDRSQDIAHHRQRRVFLNMGHAEVVQPGWTAPGKQDVGGLDVAVDDALRVRAVEGGGDLLDHLRGPVGCQPAVRLHPFGQRPPRHILQDECGGVAVLEPVQRDDVRVAQALHHGGLAPEPLGRDRVTRRALHFDDHVTAMAPVPPPVNGGEGAEVERLGRERDVGQHGEGGGVGFRGRGRGRGRRRRAL